MTELLHLWNGPWDARLLLAAATVVAAAALLATCHRQPARRVVLVRATLAALLVLPLVVALPLGWSVRMSAAAGPESSAARRTTAVTDVAGQDLPYGTAAPVSDAEVPSAAPSSLPATAADAASAPRMAIPPATAAGIGAAQAIGSADGSPVSAMPSEAIAAAVERPEARGMPDTVSVATDAPDRAQGPVAGARRPRSSPAGAFGISLRQAAWTVHALGAGGLTLWFALGWWRLARLLRRSRSAPDGCAETLADIAGPMAVRIRVVLCDRLAQPAAAWWGRPTILLPPDVVADADGLRWSLAHEHAHLRHGDARWLPLRHAATALWWFLPPLWWLGRVLERDQEHLADAAAAAADRCAYAEFLKTRGAGAGPTVGLAMVRRRSHLSRRILMLLQPTRPLEAAPPRRWRLCVTALSLAAAFGLATFRGPAVAEPPAEEAVAEPPAEEAVDAEPPVTDAADPAGPIHRLQHLSPTIGAALLRASLWMKRDVKVTVTDEGALDVAGPPSVQQFVRERLTVLDVPELSDESLRQMLGQLPQPKANGSRLSNLDERLLPLEFAESETAETLIRGILPHLFLPKRHPGPLVQRNWLNVRADSGALRVQALPGIHEAVARLLAAVDTDAAPAPGVVRRYDVGTGYSNAGRYLREHHADATDDGRFSWHNVRYQLVVYATPEIHESLPAIAAESKVLGSAKYADRDFGEWTRVLDTDLDPQTQAGAVRAIATFGRSGAPLRATEVLVAAAAKVSHPLPLMEINKALLTVSPIDVVVSQTRADRLRDGWSTYVADEHKDARYYFSKPESVPTRPADEIVRRLADMLVGDDTQRAETAARMVGQAKLRDARLWTALASPSEAPPEGSLRRRWFARRAAALLKISTPEQVVAFLTGTDPQAAEMRAKAHEMFGRLESGPSQVRSLLADGPPVASVVPYVEALAHSDDAALRRYAVHMAAAEWPLLGASPYDAPSRKAALEQLRGLLEQIAASDPDADLRRLAAETLKTLTSR